MRGFTVIGKERTDRHLTYKEMRLKEALYRGLGQDYSIIYPDRTLINVKIIG
ncbi:hypothetical protein [Aquimarina algiphila]|uniref:hypothetical protein n=1 Tax=Aquimarina algiphila TaxID=2047982 RepID=UPI0014308D14|nr:hypothetical protein [Aquimarina algiphila]